MALVTDCVPPGRFEFRRVDNGVDASFGIRRLTQLHMLFSGAVTPCAPDRHLQNWRRQKLTGSAGLRVRQPEVARHAMIDDSPLESRMAFDWITWREVPAPLPLFRVPRNGRHEQHAPAV